MKDIVYSQPHEGDAPARAATSSSSVGTTRQRSQHHTRSASEFSYTHSSHFPMMEAEEEPMEVLYEETHHRHHAEPINILSVSNLKI